jgi:hypothetical protein
MDLQGAILEIFKNLILESLESAVTDETSNSLK